MKVTVLQKDLYDKLKTVALALTSRISVYENITLIAGDDLKIFATDGTVAITATVGANVLEGGMLSINGLRFKDAIGSIPNNAITLMEDRNTLTVTCDGFKNILYTTEDNPIPIPPEDIAYKSLELSKIFNKLDWAGYIAIHQNSIIGIDDILRKKQMGLVVINDLAIDVVIPKLFATIVGRLNNNIPNDVYIDDTKIIVRQHDYVVQSGIMNAEPFLYAGIIEENCPAYIEIIPELSNAINNAGKFNAKVIIEVDSGTINIRAVNDKSGGADIVLESTGQGHKQFKAFTNQLMGAISRAANRMGIASTGIITFYGDDYVEVIAPIVR